MRSHAKAWELWFKRNFPAVDRFIYLSDGSENYGETEEWARWLKPDAEGGTGSRHLRDCQSRQEHRCVALACRFRELDRRGRHAGLGSGGRDPQADRQTPLLYNGLRPASGSFAIEDDGVALRELPGGQYKKRVDRWFFWDATYYGNYQGELGDTDVFVEAQTFGGAPAFDEVTGMTGPNTSNGDGVLFYPGTDAIFPEHSYGLAGPIASLLLKDWRRGIQDVEHLALAEAVDRKATLAIIEANGPEGRGKPASAIPPIRAGFGRRSVGAPTQTTGRLPAENWRTSSKRDRPHDGFGRQLQH